MKLFKSIGVVGSREFTDWDLLKSEIDKIIEADDEIVSGGAVGADSMAQRYAKEFGYNMIIYYPKYAQFGRSATFIRNKIIAENSDIVLAFYKHGRFQQGGTANTAKWANELGVPLKEFEEE
jgi:predicted Rossmann fold nucleotide-binding protein DprA/Smf involved in DNA uptake